MATERGRDLMGEGSKFDPADFDTSPAADPGPDYRALLDAMRQAGTEGVRHEAEALSRAITADARERAEWSKATGNELREIQRAAQNLARASNDLAFSRARDIILYVLAALVLMAGAALIYRWVEQPKEIRTLYGCGGTWKAKTGTCKGQWIPLAPAP